NPAPKYDIRPGCMHVIINLGVMQVGKQIKPVNFKFLPELEHALPDNTLSLDISMPAGGNVNHRLRLPLLDDPVDNTLIFSIDHPSEARLIFKVFRSNSPRAHEETLVGNGMVLLQDDRNCFGAQRESLVRELYVPILEKETMDFLGTVAFTFVIAEPFA